MNSAKRRELIRVSVDMRLGALHAERKFVRAVRGVLAGIHSVMESYLEPTLRADSGPWQPPSGNIPRDVDRVMRELMPQIGPKVRAAHKKLQATLERNYSRTMGKVIPGIELDKVTAYTRMQASLARDASVALVENAARSYAEQVREVFGDPAATLGVPWKELSAKLQERADVSQSRAELIARDQTLKLNGAINQANQVGLGIDGYTWSTSKDERVRATHRALDGQAFKWAAPPSVGHPGQDFQCRCIAIPVLDL